MLAWLLENTLVAGAGALLVAAAVRLFALRPALAHCLWLALLGVLLMPRIPWVETPGSVLRRSLRERWARPAPASEPQREETQASVNPLPLATDDLAELASSVATSPAAPHGRSRLRPATLVARTAAEWAPDALRLVWIGGALVVLVRSARRVLPFHRLVKGSPRAPRALCAEVLAVARRLAVQAPEVRVVTGVASPSIWCLGRPRLLWPARSLAIDSLRAQQALIAHELAHLARRDHWVSWLEIPAAALAWWNPLFWLIRGRIRHYAELSCDAWAVWTYPADRRLFAEALIDLQARTRTAPVALQGLGATDSECKDFERRLDMIMKKRMFPGVSKGAAVLATALAVLTSPGFSGGEECRAKGAECTASAVVEARAKSLKLAQHAAELFDAKQDEAALAALREVVALDPENGWAHGRIGYLQIAAGDFEAAKKSFAQQYELGYERANALYNAACAFARAGDAEGALKRLAAAVAIGLMDAGGMAKDEDLVSLQADARFQGLIEKVKTTAELRAELARLESSVAEPGGDETLFLATHAELAAILTADGKLQAEHGHLALKAGDAEGAALAFGRQAEAGFDAPTAFYNRACARSRAGDLDGALGDLRRAVELGMGYDGAAKDTDLDPLRELPGFAEVQARILAKAEASKGLKALLMSQDAADAPALAALVEDPSQAKKTRVLAAQTLGKLQLEGGRFAEAYASFERAATLGLDARQSAFDMARALAGAGKKPEALRHVALAVDLGYADPDALRTLLDAHALTAPAEAAELVTRAAELQAKGKGKAEYGEKGKAWAAGLKPAPKAVAAKVAKE